MPHAKTPKTPQDPIKYLKREYGLRPLDDLAAVLGTPPLEVEKMASRLGIPKLFAREGVMSSVQTAEALGVSPTTVMKWSRQKLAPARFGYMRNQQVLYFQREELTYWLMRPKPAWMLVKVEQVTDPIFATVMRNSQEEFPSPWLSLHEAAQRYFVVPETIAHHVRKKRVAHCAAQGRLYVYEPDVKRLYCPELAKGAGLEYWGDPQELRKVLDTYEHKPTEHKPAF